MVKLEIPVEKKMADNDLFDWLDQRAEELKQKNFIRPLTPRRKKLYLIATEVMNVPKTPKK
jgi:hypothetical protein